MVDYLVDNLTGAHLDYAALVTRHKVQHRIVPICLLIRNRHNFDVYTLNGGVSPMRWQPTVSAVQAFELTRDYRICHKPHYTEDGGFFFQACAWDREGRIGHAPSTGLLELEAAMRCYVKLINGSSISLAVAPLDMLQDVVIVGAQHL